MTQQNPQSPSGSVTYRVVLTAPDRRGDELNLADGQQLRVGRAAYCEISLDVPDAAALHLFIARAGDEVVVTNISQRAVKLGEQTLLSNEVRPWAPGDELRIGAARLGLHRDESETPLPATTGGGILIEQRTPDPIEVTPGVSIKLEFELTNCEPEKQTIQLQARKAHGTARFDPERLQLDPNASATVKLELLVPRSIPTGPYALTVYASAGARQSKHEVRYTLRRSSMPPILTLHPPRVSVTALPLTWLPRRYSQAIATYTIELVNASNYDSHFIFTFEADPRLRSALKPSDLRLKAGETGQISLEVSALAEDLLDDRQSFRFAVMAHPQRQEPVRVEGVFDLVRPRVLLLDLLRPAGAVLLTLLALGLCFLLSLPLLRPVPSGDPPPGAVPTLEPGQVIGTANAIATEAASASAIAQQQFEERVQAQVSTLEAGARTAGAQTSIALVPIGQTVEGIATLRAQTEASATAVIAMAGGTATAVIGGQQTTTAIAAEVGGQVAQERATEEVARRQLAIQLATAQSGRSTAQASAATPGPTPPQATPQPQPIVLVQPTTTPLPGVRGLRFAAEPGGALVAGERLPPIVVQLMNNNTVVPRNDVSITLELACEPLDCQADQRLSGGVTTVTQNGVAVFQDVFVRKAGSYRLRAVGAGYSLTADKSFTVRAVKASRLIDRTVFPTDRPRTLTIILHAVDLYDNLDPGVNVGRESITITTRVDNPSSAFPAPLPALVNGGEASALAASPLFVSGIMTLTLSFDNFQTNCYRLSYSVALPYEGNRRIETLSERFQVISETQQIKRIAFPVPQDADCNQPLPPPGSNPGSLISTPTPPAPTSTAAATMTPPAPTSTAVATMTPPAPTPTAAATVPSTPPTPTPAVTVAPTASEATATVPPAPGASPEPAPGATTEPVVP